MTKTLPRNFKTLKKYEVKFKSDFSIFIITQDCYFQSASKAFRWFSFEVSVDHRNLNLA